jgi:hypothetical protein
MFVNTKSSAFYLSFSFTYFGLPAVVVRYFHAFNLGFSFDKVKIRSVSNKKSEACPQVVLEKSRIRG